MIDCFAAHNSFWIDPQGHVRPCARYKEKMDHITTFNSFSDIVNSKGYVEIRQSHSKDQWPVLWSTTSGQRWLLHARRPEEGDYQCANIPFDSAGCATQKCIFWQSDLRCVAQATRIFTPQRY